MPDSLLAFLSILVAVAGPFALVFAGVQLCCLAERLRAESAIFAGLKRHNPVERWRTEAAIRRDSQQIADRLRAIREEFDRAAAEREADFARVRGEIVSQVIEEWQTIFILSAAAQLLSSGLRDDDR